MHNYRKNNFVADQIAKHGEAFGLPLFETQFKYVSEKTKSRFANAPRAVPTGNATKRISRLSQKINSAQLGAAQQKVYDVIAEKGPITNREIAAILGWQVSSVSGRNNELREFGKITDAGKKVCSITGKVVTAWKATSPVPLNNSGTSPFADAQPNTQGGQNEN